MPVDTPALRREQIQDELGSPLSYAPGVEASQPNELPTKKYVDDHGGGIQYITLATGVYHDQAAPLIVGGIWFEDGQVPTGNLWFACTGYVGGGSAATIQLYDVTNGNVVDYIDFGPAVPGHGTGKNSPVVLAHSTAYEVRVFADPASPAVLYNVCLEVR